MNFTPLLFTMLGVTPANPRMGAITMCSRRK